MLESLFGNRTVERVLFFLLAHHEAYAREIAVAFRMPVSQVQQQLLRLERGGVLGSRAVGRTRLFRINPSYALAPELTALLQRASQFIPEHERRPYEAKRKRPRATGKP
jgi:DNA-binding transcriptional ArsR family regulator